MVVGGGGDRTPVEHSWLPLFLPAGARRFRVLDERYRTTLADAGAELVDEAPDVDIGTLDLGDGSAPFVAIPLGRGDGRAASRWERRARRVVENVRLRAEAASAVRRLRRSGYSGQFATWDVRSAVNGAPVRALQSRLDRYALAVGWRAEPGPTLLAAAQRDAGLTPTGPPVIGGVTISIGADGVLRAAVGPARHQIERQVRALELLTPSATDTVIARRTPHIVRHGRTGICRWSLERRVPGGATAVPLAASILDECVDYLVALFRSGRETDDRRPGLPAAAEVIAAARPAVADEVRRLAEEAEGALAHLPRGFGHGDFWGGNLLQEDGHLTGVVDWEAAGPNRLPLLDLLHLLVTSSERVLAPEEWGGAILTRLLPGIRQGNPPQVGKYLEQLGVQLDDSELQALVVAYWLDHVAAQIELYDVYGRSEGWLTRNVDDVVQALAR